MRNNNTIKAMVVYRLPKGVSSPHARHYFVTSLLHCGVDKQTVADIVGHADTGFLERAYCHPQKEQKEQAADTMLTMLRPNGESIFNLAAGCSKARHSA